MTELMSGNEAIARGAYESGVTVAAGYPGTPSTEILENVARYKDVYCEWSPNEKVAFEMAAGASCAGARSIVTMKHVGLNVAADPLMTLSYIGVEGGFVACVADDPGMHSSQNEQDTRQYARFSKIPIFEPADSQEAKDFVRLAMDISEKYKTPTILRSTTRVSHSRSLVELGERVRLERAIGLEKNPPRFVPIPVWGRVMREKVETRLGNLSKEASVSKANRIEWRKTDIGIVTSSIAYQYAREVWPEASVLKLGFSYPFPDALIRRFADGVDQILVVEELDDFLEQHIKALGIECLGREYVSGIGELSTTKLLSSRAKIERENAPKSNVDASDAVSTVSDMPGTSDISDISNTLGASKISDVQDASYMPELPARPPVLCPGCPHRGVFYALGKHDVVVAGDIGCYSLGAFKPLKRMDIILCMGGGVSMAHGFDKAGDPRKVVGVVGDSTFFHSGITGLLDIAYNKGRSTIIVLDNRTTAMTGHQDHPGTGRTLMGEETKRISIQDIGKACGIDRVSTINPYDLDMTQKVIAEEMEASEPSLIVSEAPCPLKERRRVGALRAIDPDACKKCKKCLKLGCPAIEWDDLPRINQYLCGGCGLCEQICPSDAIFSKEATR